MAEKKEEDYTFSWEPVEEVSDFLKAKEEAGTPPAEEKEKEEEEETRTLEEIEAEKVAAAMFSDPNGKDKSQEEEGSGDDPDKDKKSKLETVADITLVESLKERGLIEYELEEGVVMTEELAAEILEDSYDDRVADEVEKQLEGMPEEAKNLNRFLLNGGKIEDYIKGLKDNISVGISKGMDMTDEKNQETMVRNKLKAENFDDDYISSEIEHLKESGRLEKASRIYYDKWEAKFKEEETNLAASQAESVRQAKEAKRKQKQSVTAFINEAKDIQGVKITSADKKLLPDYMTTKIELANGNKMTKMHNDLYAALNDPKKSVILAKMLQSDFDFKSIKQSAVTEETKDLKKKLRRNKTDAPSSTTGAGSRKLTLAERLTQ